jgi:hypothetical protein
MGVTHDLYSHQARVEGNTLDALVQDLDVH